MGNWTLISGGTLRGRLQYARLCWPFLGVLWVLYPQALINHWLSDAPDHGVGLEWLIFWHIQCTACVDRMNSGGQEKSSGQETQAWQKMVWWAPEWIVLRGQKWRHRQYTLHPLSPNCGQSWTGYYLCFLSCSSFLTVLVSLNNTLYDWLILFILKISLLNPIN